MDVRALYSSIPHSFGIEACVIFMIENCFSSMEVSNITKIIDFILTHNYCELNDDSYIQTDGTAMGKKMVPIYANIFMWNFEKYFLDNCTGNPFLYLRYMNDIFAIWQHVEDKLKQFHAYVNSIHPKIKLTLTSSATNISYLDVSVSFGGTNMPM